MISEILNLLANLSKLLNKQNKTANSEKKIWLFICYLITATCLIFLIPEFKKKWSNENSYLILYLVIVASLFLALIGVKLTRKINLISQQTFSKFLTLLVSLFLFYMLSICLIFTLL